MKLRLRRGNIVELESIIAVEHADVRLLAKPWGSLDLRPWSAQDLDGTAIGEIWFQRTTTTKPDPALLLKLLFCNEPLSIQVHPDDTFAQSIGLPHGKTEAWYILSAAQDAKVAVGLQRATTAPKLRAAIADGSIADLVRWRHVKPGDVVFVPAGTIHAIGPGLVIAEIQQRSDATFRIFDYGRGRELHIDDAVAVAHATPPEIQSVSTRLTDVRTLLIACPYFVLERIDLPPNSRWEIDAASETWVLGLDGHAQVGPISLSIGEALFLDADQTTISAGIGGLRCLAAYQAAEPTRHLLQSLDGLPAGRSLHPMEARL